MLLHAHLNSACRQARLLRRRRVAVVHRAQRISDEMENFQTGATCNVVETWDFPIFYSGKRRFPSDMKAGRPATASQGLNDAVYLIEKHELF